MEIPRERPHRDDTPPPNDAAAAAIPHPLSALQNLLAAGDAIITQSLSGDSQAFLESNRQQGGE